MLALSSREAPSPGFQYHHEDMRCGDSLPVIRVSSRACRLPARYSWDVRPILPEPASAGQPGMLGSCLASRS